MISTLIQPTALGRRSKRSPLKAAPNDRPNLNSVPTIPATADLEVRVSQIRVATGQVLVAVYNDEAGFRNSMLTGSAKSAIKGEMNFNFPQLPTGEYAVLVFHDINNNGLLDMNAFGLPLEPWGVSMEKRPMLREPTWEECQFYLPQTGFSTSVQIN